MNLDRIPGPPRKLTHEDDIGGFDSGEPALDDWLKKRSVQNELSGASRTWVVCAGRKVVGYYTLSAGAIAHAGAPGRIKRNMPDPIPAILVHAVSESAKRFYEKYGFVESPVDPLTVMIPVADAAKLQR